MDALAQPSDLASRLGQTFSDATTQARAESLLADASAVVRSYTRQDFTYTENDTAVLEATNEKWLWPPQRPVTAVTSVVIGGAALAPGLWFAQGDGLYRYEGWAGRFYGVTTAWNQPDTITITYSHGYQPGKIPDDIVRVVCKLAMRSWVNPQGLRSYQQGDMSATLASETVGEGSLDADDMRVLDRYRIRRRSVKLNAGVL